MSDLRKAAYMALEALIILPLDPDILEEELEILDGQKPN